MIVDQRGAPLAISIGAAHVHDSKLFQEVFLNLIAIYPLDAINILAADAAYDSKKILDFSRKYKFILLAANNKRRKKGDFRPYKPLHRWIVERSHAWFNNFRGLKIRWARLDIAFEAFCLFAASIQLFNMS